MALKPGDTSSIKPLKAPEALMEQLYKRLGIERPGDAAAYIKRRLREEYESNRNVKMAVETCVHCGACIDVCPTYLTTKDLYNSPVGRAELLRAVIKSEKASGRLFKGAVGAKALDGGLIDKLYTYYYQCLTCRRCAYVCPFGIDQADVTRVVRGVLYEAGLASRFVATVVDAFERTGNNMGLTPAAVINILQFAAREIAEEKKVDVKFFVYRHDQKKLLEFTRDRQAEASERPDTLLYPSSADFFMNMETLKGHLAFMHAVGSKYVVHTGLVEVANFGLFFHEGHMRIIGDMYVKAAEELGVRRAVFCECGHGWRAFKNYVAPKLRERGVEVYHIFHLAADAIQKGAVKLDPEKNGDIVYTYQDPCQYARGGDLTEEPRFIMSRVVKKWVESPHNRHLTLCCGGQAGMLADELLPLAIRYATLWYEDALKVGAQHVVRACSICKAQLSHVVPHLNKEYGRNITYSGLMDLVYKALVF